MHHIYNFSIYLYSLSIAIAALFSTKAKLRYKGVKETIKKLQIIQKENVDAENIWIHAASLGEFEQGLPIIEKLRSKNPNYKIFLTFFSPSGYEIRKNYKGVDYVLYLPMDSKKNAYKFVELLNPKIVIFIKYEFWANYLFQLKKKNIPTYIVSSIFRENQIFFKKYGKFFVSVLNCFTKIFVQDENSKQLLSNIKITNVEVTGDTRFDRVISIVENAKKLDLIDIFKDNRKIIIAGSTWSPDEDILCQYINKNSNNVKFIIAPHEVHNGHINEICNKINKTYLRYTKIQNTKEGIKELQNATCLIIDTIGILSSAYQYGNIAYIGGGFGVGIHNTLEAAVWGMPIIWGPNYNKFQEAKDLIKCGAAYSISTHKELEMQLNTLINNSQTESYAAINYVQNKCGATNKIIEEI